MMIIKEEHVIMDSDSKASMKLLIDKHSKRVLFAEANKPCVDFLFHILSLPVANILRLLKKQEMLHPWKNLYESLENLNDSYILSNQAKETLLKPVLPFSNLSLYPLIELNDVPVRKKFYACECTFIFSDYPNWCCSKCLMNTSLYLHCKSPHEPDHVGFVKDEFTYLVMDDLEIKPMSGVSLVSNMGLLKKFDVKTFYYLEEKVVNIGIDEAFKLLKATLLTEKVLTYAFVDDSLCSKCKPDVGIL